MKVPKFFVRTRPRTYARERRKKNDDRERLRSDLYLFLTFRSLSLASM